MMFADFTFERVFPSHCEVEGELASVVQDVHVLSILAPTYLHHIRVRVLQSERGKTRATNP